MKKHIPILLLFFIFMLPAFGQDSLSNNQLANANNLSDKKEKVIFEASTILTLKDGGIIKCNIINETTDLLTVSLQGQTTITIRKDLIANIESKKSKYYYFLSGATVKKRGLYLSLEQSNILEALLKDNHSENFRQISIGVMLNSIFAIGIGAGSNVYDAPENGDKAIPIYTFTPVFAEVRAYHFKKEISPYYALAVGIGIADSSTRTSFNGEEVRYNNGLFLKPVLGFRIATPWKANFFIELGYRIQNTTTYSKKWIRDPLRGYLWRDFNSSISFRRFQYTVGLLF